MKSLLLRAIRFYQRFISPHKGYACAYRVHTGRANCSGLGYRAIRRHGAWRGLLILRQRLSRCAHAHCQLATQRPPLRAQAGFCQPDLVVGICNLISPGVFTGLIDILVGKSNSDSQGRDDESRAERARYGDQSCEAAVFKTLLMICAASMFMLWVVRDSLNGSTWFFLELCLGLGIVFSWMVARRLLR